MSQSILSPARFYSVETGGPRPLLRNASFASASLNDHTLIYEGEIFGADGDSTREFRSLTPAQIAEFLLGRYLATGKGCFARIVGDFALTVITPREALAYRSLTARFQIYFSADSVSNRLWPLAVKQAHVRLDENYLLRFLWQENAPTFQSTLTPLANLHRLPAGHLVRVGNGRPPALDCLDSGDFSSTTDYRQKPDEVRERLHALMTEVVDDRLSAARGGSVFCELSGGLDSSYISSIVGSHHSPVSAYMYSTPENPTHQFSEECAQAVAERYRIDLHILRPTQTSHLDLEAPLPYSDEPSACFWQGALFCSQVNRLVPDGSTIFSGFGSDQLFLRTPDVLPWLLRQGALRKYISTLTDFSKVQGRTYTHLVYQTGLALLPRAWHRNLFNACRAWFLNPFNAEDLNLGTQSLETLAWLRDPSTLADRQQAAVDEDRQTARRLFGREAGIRPDLSYLAAPHFMTDPYFQPKSIHYTSPFCDPRLLRFVTSQVSWHLIHDYGRPYKNLLREAQKGTVPEKVRTRKKNEFNFNGYLSQMLRTNRPYLIGLLNGIEETGLDIFAKEHLAGAFNELMFGKTSTSARKIIFLLGYLIWLRDFKQHCREFQAAEVAV